LPRRKLHGSVSEQDSTEYCTYDPPNSAIPLNPGFLPESMNRMKMTKRKIVITTLLVLTVLAIIGISIYFVKVLLDTNYFFCVKSFKFISLEAQCNGVSDCMDSEDEMNCVINITFTGEFPVRISGADSILEVYNSESRTWRPVCYKDWDEKLAQATCKQLGHSRHQELVSRPVPMLSVSVFAMIDISKDYAQKSIQSILRDGSCSDKKVVSLVCEQCVRSGEERIVGGNDAYIDNWPWQVSLKYKDQHLCGGSILNSQWIVTASHCFSKEHDQIQLWEVYVGTEYLKSGGRTFRVGKIITNGQFDDNDNDYDIALIKLKSALPYTEYIRPICLPNYNTPISPNQEAWITGWGHTKQSGKGSDVLQKASVLVIDRITCNQREVYAGQITPRMLCAGFLEGKVDACQGDSGGPLSYHSDMWRLLGVVSWGRGCAIPNRPGVYANISFFLDWIYHVMQVSGSREPSRGGGGEGV
uniref:Uncharacterized protein n=1 Tax=Callorhinchus milii TaxID=7868 RepID=A0A4W3I161_CALMI